MKKATLKKKKLIFYTMFNSIRKDNSLRKLVKSFEILRLQNKIIVQAMSNIKLNTLSRITFGETKTVKKPLLLSSVSSKPLNMPLQDEKFSIVVDRSMNIEGESAANTKEESALLSVKTSPIAITFLQNKVLHEGVTSLQNKDLHDSEATGEAKAKIIGYGKKKAIPFAITVNNDKINKAFYNYNSFTDLELCNSSLHLFAKRRAKVKNENKITNLSKLPKVNDNNKNSLPKIKVSYKVFSSSLLSLAKNRIVSLPRNSSKSRIKNRCIETGRSHSVLRFCKLSRICLRDNASKALISGINKASW